MKKGDETKDKRKRLQKAEEVNSPKQTTSTTQLDAAADDSRDVTIFADDSRDITIFAEAATDAKKREKLFNACDFNRSGFIEREDMRRFCAGLEPSDIDEIFETLDEDKDGRISKTDFEKSLLAIVDEAAAEYREAASTGDGHAKPPEQSEKDRDKIGEDAAEKRTNSADYFSAFAEAAKDSEQQRALFGACDVNGSGFIEREDLRAFCADWASQDIDQIFDRLDYDNDGKISENDFKQTLAEVSSSRSSSLTALVESPQLLDDESAARNPCCASKSKRIHLKDMKEISADSTKSTDSLFYDSPHFPPSVRRSASWGASGKCSRPPSINSLFEDENNPPNIIRHFPIRRRHSICLELPTCDKLGFCTDVMCNVGYLNHSQEHVVELYQSIHTEYPQLLPCFEKIILDVIKDIRIHQLENERLEQSFKREKEQHEKHLRQLEEEMENQMIKTETRVRKEEREKSEMEKGDLKRAMEMEILELQASNRRLQQVESRSADRECSEEMVATLKDRIEDMSTENRYLKSDLTDAQTNLALVRSELTGYRTQYEEKSLELKRQKNTLMDYIREQDNLTRQLHLLHDANKKLHDTNDDLRAALDNARLSHRRNRSEPNRGSFEELDVIDSGAKRPRSLCSPTLVDDQSLALCDPTLNRSLRHQRSYDKESLPEDFDSGHSTMRDVNDFESELDDGEYYADRRNSRFGADTETETEVAESHDDMDTEVELESLRPSMSRSVSRSPSRPGSASSRSSQRSQRSTKGRHRRQLPSVPKNALSTQQITSEPERMYKVVLCGDAAVGKSSFIMRLCKGKFVNNLNSTLGVDFQTKTLQVDNRVIALQLWDTAGQERFRSIAKSYFRRADGVLLLYDVTYERSFINVREWVEAVEEGSQKKIPIMMVGNKTDLRTEYEADGRRTVKYEDGERIAKTYDALFIETSAKDGENVLECVTELARILRTNEDIEVQSAGMQLGQSSLEKSDKKSCCNM
ncbi:ras and EF-hand domain-containing protein homolog isoform X2 [Tubulanus polymorphus]|uniref:ras and EF-hand domain-containing protein homolog isoform X2 n=1 Tax=Tubulanus polymorphus TaxID=672921 RepID=UPI003DA2BDB7